MTHVARDEEITTERTASSRLFFWNYFYRSCADPQLAQKLLARSLRPVPAEGNNHNSPAIVSEIIKFLLLPGGARLGLQACFRVPPAPASLAIGRKTIASRRPRSRFERAGAGS